MDRTQFQNKILENFKLHELDKLMEQGKHLLIEELWSGPFALVLSQIAKIQHRKHLVILTEERPDHTLFEDLSFFSSKKVIEFPALENLPIDNLAPDADIVGARYEILRDLVKNPEPRIILTSLQACLQKVIAPSHLDVLILKLKKGETHPFSELPHHFSEMGYHQVNVASEKGTFALRGGIIDIFPASSMDPYRIEFLDDEIVSIRKYDSISQVSVEKVDEVSITPSEEFKFLEESKLITLFDYLGPNAIVVFDDLYSLEDKIVSLQSLLKNDKTTCSLADFFTIISSLQKIYHTSETLENLSDVHVIERSQENVYNEYANSQEIRFEAFNQKLEAKRWFHPFIPLFPAFCPPDKPIEEISSGEFLTLATSEPIDILFLSSFESEEKSLKEHLPVDSKARLTFARGFLSSGFYLKQPGFAVISQRDLSHKSYVRRQGRRSHHHAPSKELFAIHPGEAVVHMNSGIGRYLGVEKRANHLGVDTEFLLIEYAEGAKLYVPIEQTSLISKYIGTNEETPQFHALGSSRWKQALQKSQTAIKGFAEDLLNLQAERALRGGFVYPDHSELVTQFADEFPYNETPDQLAAINHIYGDMLSNRSMDRLVCGDVGYGKTEVAMRAAFKAVVDGGKQVAVLVPTTVLAMQHYETFKDRMRGFPVNIGLLSRFCSQKEIKMTLEGVKEGSVDIVIGTHRIVSEDVVFKQLGLVIIDEEQRFGVKTKEHLKKIKKDVDCLTLSATPIPRTLYLSLSGAREMSTINTPPEDRLPIQSFISHASDDVIKNALMREFTRNGQAYLIHNRVETIYEMGDRIKALLPQTRIAVAHGQMSADELDAIFHAFKTGKADLLIATSIIENGIDIPNANTILIDRADRFGLADLYQMRGRVGRWNKKAYCYFLVPTSFHLNEVARKRLSALVQSSGFGGGMKVAMHDLEIRGAGNILGVEQSGHISSIGFTLYCKLLKKTINTMQKKSSGITASDVKIEFPYDARLPEHYVNEINLRIEIYQRLGEAESEEEVDLIIQELEDRFGKAPIEVRWLHAITRLRVFAARNYFTLLKMTKVVLLAEQEVEKKKLISKKILLAPPKNPAELEALIILNLKKNFPLP